MTRIDFSRDKTKRQQHSERQTRSTGTIVHEIAAQTADALKGMGKGRQSKAADRFMGAEPVKRIDPTSPQGRAIAAKLGL